MENGKRNRDVWEKKGYQGNSFNRTIQGTKQKEEIEVKVDIGQKYIPKSGPDLKISSNFDVNSRSLKDFDSDKIVSKNKFDVLEDMEEENPFVFSKEGVNEDDLAYLNIVDQMDVIGGIPLTDTNLEDFSNDA